MRALSCRPGTALVIGVRLGGFGEITPRSVCGVKAPAGSPGSELLAGVVCELLVVRSVLAKQLTSVSFDPKAAIRSVHVTAAPAGTGMKKRNSAAQRINLDIRPSLVFLVAANSSVKSR